MSFLRPVLEAFFGPINSLLGAVPLGFARVVVVLLLVLPLVWVARLKRDFIYLGSPDGARWRDLRIWAALVTVPYVLIYLLF